jgi:hypothetical protein
VVTNPPEIEEPAQTTEEEMHVYPNPSSGAFTVVANFQQTEKSATMRIYNLAGRVLVERHYTDVNQIAEQISIPGAVNGVYVLTITKPSGTVRRKLMKL